MSVHCAFGGPSGIFWGAMKMISFLCSLTGMHLCAKCVFCNSHSPFCFLPLEMSSDCVSGFLGIIVNVFLYLLCWFSLTFAFVLVDASHLIITCSHACLSEDLQCWLALVPGFFCEIQHWFWLDHFCGYPIPIPIIWSWHRQTDRQLFQKVQQNVQVYEVGFLNNSKTSW